MTDGGDGCGAVTDGGDDCGAVTDGIDGLGSQIGKNLTYCSIL